MIVNLQNMDVYQRILGVMQNVEWVSKTGEVSFGKTNYAYVTETQILADVRPWMVEYGLVMYPKYASIQESKDGLTQAVVTYEIVAAGYTGEGYKSTTVQVVAEGADSSDKGAYKMMTGAIKVAIRQAFLIITGENNDPEATDEQGQSTGTAEVEHPMAKALNRLRAVRMLNDDDVKAVLSSYNVDLDSTDVDTQTIKQARSVSKFANAIRKGADKEAALNDLKTALN